jgi:hypothetical protein
MFTEEVLSSNLALWFSDDGHMMLYATFNDTMVEELRFPWYGSLEEGKLYPDIRSLRYPKVHTHNAANLANLNVTLPYINLNSYLNILLSLSRSYIHNAFLFVIHCNKNL